jgi:hypothetical protein
MAAFREILSGLRSAPAVAVSLGPEGRLLFDRKLRTLGGGRSPTLPLDRMFKEPLKIVAVLMECAGFSFEFRRGIHAHVPDAMLLVNSGAVVIAASHACHLFGGEF